MLLHMEHPLEQLPDLPGRLHPHLLLQALFQIIVQADGHDIIAMFCINAHQLIIDLFIIWILFYKKGAVFLDRLHVSLLSGLPEFPRGIFYRLLALHGPDPADPLFKFQTFFYVKIFQERLLLSQMALFYMIPVNGHGTGRIQGDPRMARSQDNVLIQLFPYLVDGVPELFPSAGLILIPP